MVKKITKAAIKTTLKQRKSLLFFVGILLIILPVTYLVFLKPKPIEAAWWNEGWAYRKAINITNNTSDETNVYIDFSGSNTLDTTDTTRFQTDCGDIRFVTRGGVPLKHYIVSGCGTAGTVIHVNFETLSAGKQTIYYYYGSPIVPDGSEGADFSAEADDYTIGTPAAEEVGPGPIAYWKFDEGRGATAHDSTVYGNHLTLGGLGKVEQQINILNGTHTTVSTSYKPTDNSLGLAHWDEDKYPGATVYFEAVGYKRAFNGNVQAILVDESGSTVATLTFNCADYSWCKRRSGALSLTDDTNYSVRFRSRDSVYEAYYQAARLIIVQDTEILTGTQTQVEIGNRASHSVSSATTLPNNKIYYYDSDEYRPAPTTYFEASLQAPEPTIEQQINIMDRTYSTSSGSFVPTDSSLGIVEWDADKYSGATIYLETVAYKASFSDSQARLVDQDGTAVATNIHSCQDNYWCLKRSGAITLTDDNTYTIQFKSNGSTTNHLRSARIVIVQSDSTKITETSTQIEVGDQETGFTNTSYSPLTDYKIYYYDQDQFSPTPESSGDVEFHATLKIDDSGDTVYAQLWNNTDSAQVAELSHSGDENYALEITADIDNDVDWDSTDDYIVRIRCNDDNGGGCSGNIVNAKIVLDQSDAGGISDVEMIHMYNNTLHTDGDTGWTNQNTMNDDNIDTFFGGDFEAYFESTLKAAAGTASARLTYRNPSMTINAVSSSQISTTETDYTRVRGSTNIYSNINRRSGYGDAHEGIDLQLVNSGSNTTSAASSWLVIQASNLETSATTIYADLYNITDSSTVTNSQISTTTSISMIREKSSAITLATGKEYVARLWSSTGARAYMGNAKIIHDQSGIIHDVEVIHHYISDTRTDSDTTYSDMVFDNDYYPDNFNASDTKMYFEAVMKTTDGTGYAILENDTNSADISGSELTTSSNSYERQRSGDIYANMPATTKAMDTQLKNSATNTTYVSLSNLIIQLSSAATGTVTSWRKPELCASGACINTTGSNKSGGMGDGHMLDFAGSDSFTLVAWFKHPEISTSDDVLISKFESTDADGGYRVLMDSSGDLVFGIDDDNTSFPEDSVSTTTSNYDDNRWHHVAAVKDGISSMKLYIDGEYIGQDDTISATGTLENNDIISIGTSMDGGAWEGFIDEVKVYRYARSADEIKTDFADKSGSGATAVLGAQDQGYLSDGLVGYWKMDDDVSGDSQTIIDYSGNGNDGITDDGLSEDGMDCTGTGKYNHSCDFDGSDDYISVSDTDVLDTMTEITLSAWIYLDSVPSLDDYTIFSKHADPYFYTLDVKTSQLLECQLSGLTPNNVTSNSTIPLNTWTHVVCTYDGSFMKLYIDGELDKTLNNPGPMDVAGTGDLYIGDNQQNSPLVFDGDIDEVRIYNRTLSSHEVESLYKWAPGPVGYWKMDEGSGQSTNDSSGNDNAGELGSTSTADTYDPIWTTGKYGSALEFAGSDDYVDAGTDPSLAVTEAMTLSAWVYRTGSITDGRILHKRQGNFESHYGIVMDGNDLEFRVHDCSTTTDYGGSSYNAPLNEWTYVAATYDDASDTVKLYKNGVLDQTTTTFTRSTCPDLAPVEIGGHSNHGSGIRHFDGKIDEVRIYNYVRTQEQIIQDMNAGHPAPGSPVGSALGHWKFDEGYGTTVNDSGIGSNNGTLGTGDSAPSWTLDGKFDRALDYDNSNDYVDMGDIIDLSGSDDLTVSGWFNRDTADSDDTVLAKRNGITAGDTGYIIYIDDANDTLIFEISDGTDEYQLESSTTFTSTGWNHFTAVWDEDSSSASEIYINGKDDDATDTGTIGDIDAVDAGNLRVGTETDSGNPFDGKIDDIRIYNFALSESQAKTLYAGGSTQVLGALSTDGTGPASWAAFAVYCPPGDSATCDPPVAEYLFDKNDQAVQAADIVDTSGNNNTASGASLLYWTRGKHGSGARSTGAGSAVVIGDDPSLDINGSYTVSAWVKNEQDVADSGYAVPVGKSTNVTPAGNYSLELSGSGGNDYMGTCFYDSVNGWKCLFDDTTNIPLNEWHHFTAVMDDANDEFRLYHDGVLIKQAAETDSPVGNPEDLGLFNDSNQNFDFIGVLDNVRIYDYARTPAQVAWEYNRGGPVGWWKLDECSSTTANDSGSGGNNLTIAPGSNGNTSAGTCQGGSLEMWANGSTGKISASLDFDGSDDYASCSDGSCGGTTGTGLDMGTRDITVSAWVKPTQDTAGIVVGKQGDDTSTEEGYVLHTRSDRSGDCTLTVNGSTYSTADDGTALPLNEWSHLMCVFDRDGNLTRYYNGKEDGTAVTISSQDGQSADHPYNFCISGRDISDAGCSHLPFPGQIDEVKVWTYSLTGEQIKTDYASGAVRFN